MDVNAQQDPYKNIRPYHDNEVEAVLQSLLYDDELIGAITHYQFPRLPRWISRWLKPVIRIALAREFGEIQTIKGFQLTVARYMSKMIARSTTKLSCSGMENLEADEAYLFISNHRDIAMDPAFVNWVRHQNGMDTVRIAIGDNLLRKPYVSDLMRLNKSFIVNRSAKAPREVMAAVTQLSSYINFSIQEEESSIWIAQREGRAKDGNDFTDPALLKMLYISQRKKGSFSEVIKRLNVVPVSISYEFDPCDRAKARELAAKESSGQYEKSQYEDIESIVKGITGQKGAVHVHFGDVITGDFDTPESLAAELDRQIHLNYHLHASNYIAAGQLDNVTAEQIASFEARLAGLSETEQAKLKQMYANPVVNCRKDQQESA
ncbi:1-acyl-sn-glycerol-3-phosphate acyltransferase [Neptunomonas phycophila]|uniref:1-acyl-sn-glycerol-3-phosphate acyltransferase n=1 Tax=Neptunomonas phycophila TaxID=1572645 RepID=UPI001BE8F165|nr:1-acyl-sn-glycerol-3-phosphate acyltransferase [Neptunomonas phycophila]MBT3145866.1 1-acyl-sn-glycerol-3-phosphate acyltransferase [Neptunomonas phycophila]